MESAFGGSHRVGREVTPDVLPASQYLQERLQERRARNIRPKRLRQSDFGPRKGRDDDIFTNEAETNGHATNRAFDSSPMVAGSRNGSELGDSTRRRALGVKGLDEHMDRLTKENFALKLELDHRREHTAKLQGKIDAMRSQVERADQLQEEHSELLRINSQLVEELEKRDKAVEEAMDIICDLEDKVTDMEERHSCTRPSTANADSGYAGTETHEQAPPSSPPEPSKVSQITPAKPRQPTIAVSAASDRLLKVVNEKTPARARREPSVLSQKKQSTHALRSVYLETTQSLHPVKSFNSFLTRRESRTEDDEEALNSPRLSVLSESSFPSLYSPKEHASSDRFAWEVEDEPMASIHQPTPHLRQDSIKRVSLWMDEGDLTEETPSKSNRITAPLSHQTDNAMPSSPAARPDDGGRFQSLGDALGARPGMVKHPSPEVQQPVQYIRPFPIRTDPHATKGLRPTGFGGPIFGEPLLPPTPESASTRMLRASRSSMDDEKSLLDTTPAAVRGYDALEPDIRTAPRQMRGSVELNNAYKSFIQRRNEADVDYDVPGDDDADASSETVRDLSLEYDGFPDGGSILMGTPSRFLKHGKPPAKTPFDGYDLSPTEPKHPPFTRRQTSSETTAWPRKPSISRADTSPTLHHTYGRIMTAGLQSSTGSVTSPRSYHSGSSSSRTVFHTDERDRTISPDLFRIDSLSTTTVASAPRSRTSPSPARTLGQKAQGLLRRMSNTQRDSGSDREKSPLPTLTTAPSSAYVNDMPKQARRPGTSHSGGDTPRDAGQRTSRSRENKRPSVSTRTNTAPTAPTLPLSALNTERRSLDTERKNFFRRSNSAKKWPHTPIQENNAAPQEGSGMRNAMRRGSIKDAVTSAAALAIEDGLFCRARIDTVSAVTSKRFDTTMASVI